MRNTLKREFYIPANAKELKIAKNVDVVAYTYKVSNNHYALAFAGKAIKPSWHYRFKNIAQRNKTIKEFVQTRLDHLAEKKERRINNKRPHTYKVGDILYSTWGYEQTNVDFYQVLSVTNSTIKIQPIRSHLVESFTGYNHVAPIPNSTFGTIKNKKPNRTGENVYVKIDSFSVATLWDGSPKHETAAGWGH